MFNPDDVIKVAEQEVGYLEKSSNAQLDDKTANAGDKNYTKYGRDLIKWVGKPYANGVAWCDLFTDYCFIVAYGLENAKKLLINWSAYTPTSAQYFKDKKQWYTSNPKKGDLIFFKNDTRICHTGIVYDVDSKRVYTIEGNTSSGRDVVIPNGGAVCKKSYELTNTRIAGFGRPAYGWKDETLPTPTPSPTPSPTGSQPKYQHKCVDISHHNVITDWNTLRNEFDTIIIRMGYISYVEKFTLTVDKKFPEHFYNAIQKNMNIGLYCWDQSKNEAEAIQLADFCLQAIEQYTQHIKLPIFIDSENYTNNTGRADKISKEQRTKNIIAFCERIKSRGYKAGVYASDSWFKTKLDFDKIKQYEIWVARYSENNPSIAKYEAWQYGSEQFKWATKPIDVNWFYKKYNKESVKGKPGVVICNKLNMRSTPIVASDNGIAVLVNGNKMTILDEQNDWLKIKTSNGQIGWVFSSYINII